MIHEHAMSLKTVAGDILLTAATSVMSCFRIHTRKAFA